MYTDDFKKAVHKDIIRRMDEDKNFELEVDNLCQTLGEDKTRNIAYEEYAKKPEFKQYLEEKGTFSQFFDDMSNTGKAWDSGDFLGHFQSIARSGMTGDYKSQEQAYQNYKKWAEANPQPEGKTWLGKIALGVANQLNLMGDMQPEALATGLATGGTFAGIASATNAVATPVIGAPTTLGAGVIGFKTGYGASNLKQGYEIGFADAYTALRDEGIDQATANSIAEKVAVPYALLELLKLKHIPGVRKLVGGKTIADILKNIADDKIKNKAIRAFTKKGIDLGVATTVGTATEVAQRAMTEIPKYPAKNESVQWGDVANAMYEEGKAVLPAMIGTAGLGSVVEHVATRPSKLEKDITRVNEAIEEGKQILEQQKQKQAKVQKKNVVDIPADAKLGEDFIGPDGKKYRNVDGIAMPVIVIGEEESTNNLDADAESENVKPDGKEETKQEEVKKAYSNPLTKIELPPVATEESQIHQQELQDELAELAYGHIPPMTETERQNLEYEQAKKLEAEKKLQAESDLDDYVEKEIQRQENFAKAQANRENKLRKLQNKSLRKNRVSDRIAKIERLDFRLEAIDAVYEAGEVDKLTDDQLYEAWANGLTWAEKEIQKREDETNTGSALLDVMAENGMKLPTPNAIVRHANNKGQSLSGYLYGEIKDLYDSLPKDKQLKYFSKNYVNLDETAETLSMFGFKYDTEADFISDVADNLSGRKVSTGFKFSLTENDFSKMSDSELIEAHAKAERVNDVDNGRAITDEWLKRKGYNTDVYHGSPNHNIRIPNAEEVYKKNAIDFNEYGKGFYATESKDVAEGYAGSDGVVYPLKHNLKPSEIIGSYTWIKKYEKAWEKEIKNEFKKQNPDVDELDSELHPINIEDLSSSEVISSLRYLLGDKYKNILQKYGLRGIVYEDTYSKDATNYVSFNGRSDFKSRDAFTYDDDGNYIPLDKRGDVNNADIRYSIKEDDAQRFRDELQDYIDEKLDNRHIFRLGTTPEAMRLCGAKDIPLELTASTLSTKEAKHSLKLQALKDLPVEIADPIAIFQSSQIPDGLVVLTELKDDDNNQIVVAVHLEKKRNRNLVNDIRSIHGRSDYNIQTQIDRGLLLYLNTKRKPYSLRPNRVPPVGGSVNKASYGSKIFTQDDLSQEEKDNIFRLRGENQNYRYSVSEKDTKQEAKIESIVDEIESIKARFNKKAKFKSKVDVVGTVQKARQLLHSDDIPSDARGIQTGEKIVLVAENLDDAETGARVFLHEQVGHFGLRRLLGKDLKPFLNYVIKHYEGTKAWNKIASKKEYAKQGKYAIAEEMLAHLAENRELSDPSMWKRLVHRVKRAIWGNGVPQEYVNLLNEDTLRSAIVLSREWAKGNHYLNANGVWESVKNTRRAKDVPEDENFSLNDEQAQRQYDEVVAKYKGTPQWLKAPNGQPTKLTERQWVMVRTPNFKKWFGDWENNPQNASKVVDENGEPLVVYHGTNWEFNSFKYGVNNNSGDRGYLGRAFYATNDLGIAETYADEDDGRVMELFLNIRNPYISKDSKHTSEPDSFANDIGVDTYAVSRYLQNKGFDGVISETEEYARNDSGVFYKEYAVYESNQIKSATDNIGAYDSGNNDIRFSFKETRSQAELDELNAKFKDLYEQYKNSSGFERLTTFKQALDLVKAEAERKGYVVKVYHGTGADGFNVAKADSSEEQNGEGNQAHGAGLYMAVSRDVAEGYKDSAIDKSEYEKLSRLKIKGLPLSDILDWKILIDENQEVLKIMFSEMVNTPYIFSFDEYIEIQNDWIKKSNNDYDRAVHNQAKKAIETIKKAFKEKGIRTDDVSIADVEGHLFNWLTNLNDDNTLDEDWAIYQHEKPVQEAYKKAYEEDILPILKESYGFDEDELEWAKGAFDTSRKVGGIVRSARTYIGADKFREIMLKHGIKGLTYNGRQDGRCYVSFEGGSTVKLQDPFTFDDNGELIPLTERFNEDNADMRFSIKADRNALDREHRELYERYKGGDKEAYDRAKELVASQGVLEGYFADNDFRMNHKAPNRFEDDVNASLYDIREKDILPKDFWQHPEWYAYSYEEKESFYIIKRALEWLDNYKREGRSTIPAIKVYRAIPKDVKEDNIRNGDWVTPSKAYAQQHGESNLNGNYRIITQLAKLNQLYFNGDSIAELGYDDGESYAYKNTKNNRKLLDPFTFDDNDELIPLSKRFKKRNADMRFSLVEEDSNADIPLSISEKKNLEKFKQNIKKGSSRLDVSKNKAYKNNGLNCDRIIVHKFVLDEAEKLGIDSDKIPYELLRPTKIFGGNKDIKNIRILTTLKGKQNRLVCLQGSRDVNNIVVLRDILGYREERIDDLLEIESIYTNEKKARLLKNRANYTDNQTDTISSPNELSKIVSSDFSKESQDEKFENTMNYADEILQTKRNKVIYSLRQMGVDVIEDKRANDKSQYIEVNLDNGGTIYVRVSDHPAKTRIDVSIEQDWKAGTRFIYDQVNKNDWGTKENPYWQGDARLRFSLDDSKPREKYDGRYGRAQRKYTKLLGQKRNELGRHVEYDELPDLTTDDEFKSVVGMTKKEYADLMQERDKVANEMRYEYQKTGQKFKQAQVDRYNPIKIIERIINGGDLLGAEKSAYKSLFTAGNMDEVMYNAIYVGLPQYDRKSGTYKIRKGYKPLIQYFEKVKGEKYDNFQNYAQAVAMLEHYARSHNLETIEDALKWADSKEFEEMAGFSKADAKKWIEEATQESKDTVDALQELFRANREFMVETGLASSKQAEVLNSFEYYLPMLRQFEDADTILSGDGGGFKSRGFSGRSSGVKEFVGSKAKIKNVMESIIERTASLYANGYKNVAMQRNIQMLSEFGLAKHSAKASVRVQARIEQAKNALEREGIKVEGVRDESELIPLEAFHIINSIDEQIRDNIVSVRSNGNLIFYHIADPELLVALKSLGAEQQKLITTLFTKAKNVMTWGVTKLPAFAVRNFLRDTGGNAIILGNNPAKSVVNFAKSIKDTPQMQSIRMSGMGGASWYPVSATGATLDFGKGNAWKKAKRVGKYILTPFKAYDRILQASEQANRISAYDKAIAEGLSEAEASFRASDVLNFGMRGSGVWTGKNYYAKSAMEILSWLIRISPFVNAGIQGLFKAYREAGFEKGFFDAKDEFSKKAKAKKVMQALNKSLIIRGAILASASVLYSIYANSSEDDDGEKWYEKLSDDEKLSYWHFYMGDNKILRVPKPFEIGYLFSTIPTAMTDAMLQDNPETAKLLWRGMTDQLRFDFASNPIIDTAIENWRNKDSFRKTPIVERSDLNLPSQMQYSADTTSTAKALSIIPNMIPLLRDTWASSPARVQNVMDNFFGGMSQYGTYLTDSIVESFSSIEGGTSRYARTSPLTKAYDWSMRDTRTMRYKNAEKFYELKGRIDELYASARVYKQSQQLDKLQELLDENKAEFGNYEIVNALNTKLNEIATKRRKLGSTKTYSTEELIELDDKLLAERNKLLNYTDLIIERLEAGKYDERDLRAIIKRIENVGKPRKESQKADRILRSLK